MYLPASFREEDRSLALDFIDHHDFATLISWDADGPMVSHLPLLLDRSSGRERLLGHLARANRHWSRFDGSSPALAIFHGPHAYVSPSWYATHPSVPTWNYAVVHVRGAPSMVDSEATRTILERLVEKHERDRTDRWAFDLPPDFVDRQLRAIVGFEMPVASLEAKFKLSQNKDERDREGALRGLEREDHESSRALAAFARRYFASRGG